MTLDAHAAVHLDGAVHQRPDDLRLSRPDRGRALLVLDRYLGMHFFTNGDGGNMMNYPNLFWIWGHPEVYILILPAFGVYSRGRRDVLGQAPVRLHLAGLSPRRRSRILSFTVWLHHFFTMGASANVNAFFGIATMLIAVPTGVKVFDWLLTMFRGRIIFHSSMLWTLGFIVTFVIGGMTGVLLALPPADYLMHNTTFLVAHFHNMLIPGALFGYFAGYMYWFPKAFGFTLNERWGVRAFWFWLIGFYLAFMPLYALGFMGMPRRLEHYNIAAWQPYLIVAALGALLILVGIGFLVVQFVVSVQRPAAGARSQRRSMERAHAGMADLLAARAVQFCGAARGAGHRRLPRHEGGRRRLSQARALSRHHHAQEHQRRPHAGGPGRPARFRHDLVHLVDGDRIRALHVGRDHRARLR